jgi:hypothetical protein
MGYAPIESSQGHHTMSQTGPQAIASVLLACTDIDTQVATLTPLLFELPFFDPPTALTTIKTDNGALRAAALNLQTLLGNCTAQNAAATQAAAAPGLETLALKSADVVVQQGVLRTSSPPPGANAPLAAIQTDALTIQNAVGDLQTAFAACGSASAPSLPAPAPAPTPSAGISRGWTTALLVGGAALLGGLFIRALHRPPGASRARAA